MRNCSPLLSGEKRSMSILFLTCTFIICIRNTDVHPYGPASYPFLLHKGTNTTAWTYLFLPPLPLLQTIILNNLMRKFVKLHLQKNSTIPFQYSSEGCSTTYCRLPPFPDGYKLSSNYQPEFTHGIHLFFCQYCFAATNCSHYWAGFGSASCNLKIRGSLYCIFLLINFPYSYFNRKYAVKYWEM